ncbi:phytanoyl-CoA dioxygenase family protein [Nonomuraea dietziae]|uniref:phytanoyl-CoA dioxygenase family protein n=1 Tax=Nonomuraea dietziae TaxID=65515 RepID=UPI0033CC2EEF
MAISEDFVANGFVKIRAASDEVGLAAQALLWKQIGLAPDDPSGWTEPVRWAADLTGEGPFGQIINSPELARALDEVCGQGGWRRSGSCGNIPIRFPKVPPADDRGWHLDLNVMREDGSWAVSARSATLLILILFSEVGPDDAPTRIRVGSQRDSIAALGEGVHEHVPASRLVEAASAHRPLAHATGAPGEVYLVHPLTVHAAQEHLGTRPRFMAQAPVFLSEPLDPSADTPLARAVR